MMNIIENFLKLDVDNGVINIGKIFSFKLDSLYALIGRIISSIIIAIIMFALIKIGNKAIDKFVQKQAESKLKFSLDNKRATTLGAILKSVLKYTVYFLGIAAIVDKLVGGLSFAFAGIGGAVLAFGAKDIINDITNGFFIVFEEQFSVGDYITIDDKFSGIVTSIGLRSTKLEDLDGNVHIMPNGSINVVTNRSKGSIRMLIDMDIAYEEDIENAINVINETCISFSQDNEDIIEEPRALGVTDLKESGVCIRIVGRVTPLTKLTNEVRLRQLLKEAFDRSNIEIPYKKIQLVNTKSEAIE